MTSTSRAVSPLIAMGLLVFVTVGVTVSAGMVIDERTNLVEPHPTPGTQFDRKASQHVTITLVASPKKGDVFIRSPLGTETALENAGDRRMALAFANGPTQIIVKSGNDTYVATSRTIKYGVNPDVIVAPDGTEDYKTVQAAVDNAPKGSTIAVQRNIYSEAVDLDRSVDIVAETGTVFTPSNGSPAFTVSADNLSLQNIHVRGNNSGTGIVVSGSGVSLAGNRVTRLSTGIKSRSQCLAVTGNVITGNDEGVYVSSKSNGTYITENDLSNNSVTIHSDTSKSILAALDYWGSDDPRSTVEGNVNVTDPLNSYEGPFTIGQRDATSDITDSDSGHGNECGSPTSGDDEDNPGGGTDSAPGGGKESSPGK